MRVLGDGAFWRSLGQGRALMNEISVLFKGPQRALLSCFHHVRIQGGVGSLHPEEGSRRNSAVLGPSQNCEKEFLYCL